MASPPPLTLAVSDITLNCVPSLLINGNQQGPVTLYPAASMPPGPVLLAPSTVGQGGLGSVTVQISGACYSQFMLDLYAYTEVMNSYQAPNLIPAGVFRVEYGPLGPLLPGATMPPITIDLQAWPNNLEWTNQGIMGLLPTATSLMCRNLQWFCRFWANGLPIGPYPQALPVTVSEIYFAPAPTPPTTALAIEDLRIAVAQDLVQPWLLNAGTSAQGIAGACTNAAWQAPPNYDFPQGRSSYGGIQDFDLQDWLCALHGINPAPATCNCEDAAAMCCLILEQQALPAIGPVWAGRVGTSGSVNPTAFRGVSGQQTDYFGYHFVGMIEIPGANGPFVCDATIGPHLGTETGAQYIANAYQGIINWDSTFTEPPPTFASSWAPVEIDDIAYTAPAAARNPPSLPPPLDTDRVTAFAKALGIAPGTPPSTAMIACHWPDPRACPAVPASFKCVHCRTTFGYPISDRYWVLADGANALHLKVWVASDGTRSAWQRFLREGTAHDTPGPIFEKGIGVGDVSAKRAAAAGAEHLWVRANVVCAAQVVGQGIDLEKVATWLDGIAAAAKPEDFKPPVISSVAVSNPQPVVGTRFTIDVATDASYPLALRGVQPTLQLVDGNGKQLTLAARQLGDADLTVIAGAPDTLLSAQRSTHIAVSPAA